MGPSTRWQAREEARKAAREADRAEGPRMVAAHGRLWRPGATIAAIGQCLSGGLGWLEIECNRCKTRASLPLDAIRRSRDTPLWKWKPR